MASKTALMLRSLLRSHVGGPVVCPPSVSLSSEDIKSRALSMLSKALAFSLSCAGRFALISEQIKKQIKVNKYISEMISYHFTGIIFSHGFITMISTHNM